MNVFNLVFYVLALYSCPYFSFQKSSNGQRSGWESVKNLEIDLPRERHWYIFRNRKWFSGNRKLRLLSGAWTWIACTATPGFDLISYICLLSDSVICRTVYPDLRTQKIQLRSRGRFVLVHHIGKDIIFGFGLCNNTFGISDFRVLFVSHWWVYLPPNEVTYQRNIKRHRTDKWNFLTH